MVYDVAIIGAGVTGAMTAFHLAKYDLKIAIIEEKESVGAGISKANSAIVHAGYDAVPGTLKAKLNVRGCKLMPEICRQLGVHYLNCSSHVVALSDEDMKTLEMLYSRGKQNGIDDIEIITAEKLSRLEENISPDAKASLWAKSAGIVSPYGLAVAAIENALTNGADIFLESKVTDIKQYDDIIEVSAGSNKIRSRFVVNAAGLYADSLARMIGDCVPDITPRRGEYYILDRNSSVKVNSVIFRCPSEKGKGVLVSPTVHGNIIVGPSAEVIHDKDDKDTTQQGLEFVKKAALTLVPSLRLSDTITTFAGIRPTPSSGDFFIRQSESIKGLINAVGIESPGLASAPATGEYIAQMLFSIGLSATKRANYIETTRKSGNIKMFAEMSDEEKRHAIANDSSYGRIICRCESVTEGDIKAVLQSPLPSYSTDDIKRRTRAGMGRCQSGFCQPSVAKLIAEHHGSSLDSITKCGGRSKLLESVCPKGGGSDGR